jgi:hypothetical protein
VGFGAAGERGAEKISLVSSSSWLMIASISSGAPASGPAGATATREVDEGAPPIATVGGMVAGTGGGASGDAGASTHAGAVAPTGIPEGTGDELSSSAKKIEKTPAATMTAPRATRNCQISTRSMRGVGVSRARTTPPTASAAPRKKSGNAPSRFQARRCARAATVVTFPEVARPREASYVRPHDRSAREGHARTSIRAPPESVLRDHSSVGSGWSISGGRGPSDVAGTVPRRRG